MAKHYFGNATFMYNGNNIVVEIMHNGQSVYNMVDAVERICPIVVQYPSLVSIIKQYPQFVNSIANTGLSNKLVSYGNSYISTGINAKGDYVTKLDLTIIEQLGSTNRGFIFGSTTSYSVEGYGLLLTSESVPKVVLRYGSSVAENNNNKYLNKGQKYNIELNKNNLYFDNTLVCSGTYSNFSNNKPIIIFGFTEGSSTFTNTKVKIGNFVIKNGDEYIINLFPFKKPSGECGMIDLAPVYANTWDGDIDSIFYGNANSTGSFSIATEAVTE